MGTQLDLSFQADLEGLSEANLDLATVQLVFLPHELDAARASLDEARKIVQADARWLASYTAYEPTLDALATTHSAHNVATALGLILALVHGVTYLRAKESRRAVVASPLGHSNAAPAIGRPTAVARPAGRRPAT